MIKLYDFFNSGASYRTRIALNLKKLDYEQIPIHLTRDGGKQFSEEYSNINPQNYVPTLIDRNEGVEENIVILIMKHETRQLETTKNLTFLFGKIDKMSTWTLDEPPTHLYVDKRGHLADHLPTPSCPHGY